MFSNSSFFSIDSFSLFSSFELFNFPSSGFCSSSSIKILSLGELIKFSLKMLSFSDKVFVDVLALVFLSSIIVFSFFSSFSNFSFGSINVLEIDSYSDFSFNKFSLILLLISILLL
jgi:hypothetical protein